MMIDISNKDVEALRHILQFIRACNPNNGNVMVIRKADEVISRISEEARNIECHQGDFIA